MPHLWALPTALVFTTYGIGLSLYTFISPLAAARLYGLDLDPSTIPTCSGNIGFRFVPVFGGRNLATGLAILALYWQEIPRAMGTVMICCAAAGIVDTVITGLWGTRGKALEHGIGSAALGLTGWGLMV